MSGTFTGSYCARIGVGARAFHSATDERTGYPADDHRLVQRWAWYSLNDDVYDPQTGIGFNGNLFDRSTHEIAPLGVAYGTYTYCGCSEMQFFYR